MSTSCYFLSLVSKKCINKQINKIRLELQTEFDRRIKSRNFCRSTTYSVFVGQSIWQKWPVLRECCSLCCMKCCVLWEMYKRYCAHCFVRFGEWFCAQQLHALVFSMLQIMQRAWIACEFATDSTRGVASLHCCLRYCEWCWVLCCKLYCVQKPYIAAVSHDAECVSCWHYAAFDVNKSHGTCSVQHMFHTLKVMLHETIRNDDF